MLTGAVMLTLAVMTSLPATACLMYECSSDRDSGPVSQSGGAGQRRGDGRQHDGSRADVCMQQRLLSVGRKHGHLPAGPNMERSAAQLLPYVGSTTRIVLDMSSQYIYIYVCSLAV